MIGERHRNRTTVSTGNQFIGVSATRANGDRDARSGARAVGWMIVAAYAIVTGFLLLRHDMWRDEAQLWLISKASTSPWDLAVRTSHEIRPLGWFMVCWLVSRFTANMEVLKVVNWLISIAMAATVVHLLPVRRMIQVLFLGGFLMLVGYSSVSEDYMLGTLLFLLCIVAVMRRWSFVVMCLLLAALGNIHFLFLLMAIPGLGVVTLERVGRRIGRGLRWTAPEIRGCVMAWALCAFSLALIWPSSDNRWSPDPALGTRRLAQGLNAVTAAIFPWMDSTPQTFDVANHPVVVTLMSSVIALAVVVFAWRRSPLLGVYAIASSGLLIGYFTFSNYYYWWHLGVLLLNLVGILFLTIVDDRTSERDAIGIHLAPLATLLFVLAAQVYAVFVPPGYDLLGNRPYSTAKRTIEFVRSVCASDCVVLVSQELNASAIAGYLERPVYYVDRGRMGTYAPWGDRTYLPREWPDIVAAARLFPKAIIITDERRGPPQGVDLLASFSGAVWPEENFEVWRLSTP